MTNLLPAPTNALDIEVNTIWLHPPYLVLPSGCHTFVTTHQRSAVASVHISQLAKCREGSRLTLVCSASFR